jgi:hypothetical protein
MAKQKIDLPSTDDVIQSSAPNNQYAEIQKQATEKAMQQLNIPAEQLGYVSRHIDVKMNRDQASKFKSIMRKLEDENKQLKDGTPVNNKRRAVLWLIENA